MTVYGALAVALVNLLVGLYGTVQWYRVEPAPRFWPALRAAQVLAVVYALYGGILVAAGEGPEDGLYVLYAVLPVAIGFVAEQLKLISAQTVLDARGIPEAKALADRGADEQRSVVTQILRRELGVMAASALVVAFLALRAAGSA